MPDGVFQQHAVRFFVNTKNKYLMITAKPLGILETASDRVSAAAGIGMHAGWREPANVDIVFWRKVQYIPPFQQRFFKLSRIKKVNE